MRSLAILRICGVARFIRNRARIDSARRPPPRRAVCTLCRGQPSQRLLLSNSVGNAATFVSVRGKDVFDCRPSMRRFDSCPIHQLASPHRTTAAILGLDALLLQRPEPLRSVHMAVRAQTRAPSLHRDARLLPMARLVHKTPDHQALRICGRIEAHEQKVLGRSEDFPT